GRCADADGRAVARRGGCEEAGRDAHFERRPGHQASDPFREARATTSLSLTSPSLAPNPWGPASDRPVASRPAEAPNRSSDRLPGAPVLFVTGRRLLTTGGAGLRRRRPGGERTALVITMRGCPRRFRRSS